jgi:multidrug efflux pump subunit AcrB
MRSLIGLIMLMGIATKNSILLVEYAIVARRGHDGSDGHPVVAAMSRHDALIDACHKRARPAGHHDHAGHGCGHVADCRGLRG